MRFGGVKSGACRIDHKNRPSVSVSCQRRIALSAGNLPIEMAFANVFRRKTGRRGRVRRNSQGSSVRGLPVVAGRASVLGGHAYPFRYAFTYFVEWGEGGVVSVRDGGKGSGFFLLALLKVLATFKPFIASVCLPDLPSVKRCFGAAPSLMRLNLATDVVKLTTKRVFFNPLDSGCKHHSPVLTTVCLFVVSAVNYVFTPAVRVFTVLHLLRKVTNTNNVMVSHSITASVFANGRLTGALTVVKTVGKITPMTTPVVKKNLARKVS